MEVKNLYDTVAYNEIIQRINQLRPDSERLWGKMNVSQMLAHCIEAFKVPLSEKPLPRFFLGRLLGWIAKGKLYNDQPWGKSLPTAPNFIIKDQRDFEKEKAGLVSLINQFYEKGPEKTGLYPHPFFGTLKCQITSFGIGWFSGKQTSA